MFSSVATAFFATRVGFRAVCHRDTVRLHMSGRVNRVLIIDDDSDARRALQELLELHGYEVAAAADGGEALACLRGGFAPCLILLDLRMPRMDGWQFREAQLLDPELKTLPVVVFSGDAEEEAAAEELGLQHFLRKPLDFAALISALDRHCAA